MDESESLFIKMAYANMDAKLEGPVKAFFWLALEAILQLTRIADANARLSARLDKWDSGRGMLDVVTHELGDF